MMNEADTRANLIDPVLKETGWWGVEYVLREYFFTDGRKLVGNKRGERLKADYLLRYNNIRLAFVEAKAESLDPTDGLEQVKNYGEKLGLPIVYSTNGHKIYEFDLRTGRGTFVESYPKPEELYQRIYAEANPLTEQLLSIPLQNSGKQERYYQEIAIRRTMEAVAAGKRRVLLTLATGTGKTYIAFQIAYKLYEAKWNTDGANRRPKILFLADRNILADQAINAFNYFEHDLIKITGKEIRKRNGKPPTERNFYFAIYQAIADRTDTDAAEDEDELQDGFYKLYPPDFFDAIIIDECHRGSATDDGNWRKILDYFGNALHLGLTATPRRQDNADTYQYFGEPIYQYSLIDGINDGFLTPYKVLRLRTNIDTYKPQPDDTIVQGSVDKEEYQLSDFERTLVVPERTALLARQILAHVGEWSKAIVFCVTQQHAADMRNAIDQYKTSRDPNYCVRITSNDGKAGKELLELFKNNEKTIPNIVTSSQMLTTGVDVLNVRNIVLVRQINSMVEFKQIVGRGTRLYEGKDFFTIIDFTGATELFQDEEWDGPIDVAEAPEVFGDLDKPSYERPQRETILADEVEETTSKLLTIQLNQNRRLQITDKKYFYVSANGKTLDAEAYLREIMGHLPSLYQSEEQLRRIWQNPNTRKDLLQKLEAEGLSGEQLLEFKRLLHTEDSDIIDVLAYLQYNREPLTYTERVLRAKADDAFFQRYQDARARRFLHFILEQYEQHGIQELDTENLSQLLQRSAFRGNRREAVQAFGGDAKQIQQAFLDLQKHLFQS